MISISVRRVATVAPGLNDWPAASAVLAGDAPYRAAPIPKYKTSLLPSNETRRMTETTRLAFAVLEACLQENFDLPSVFASYSSDVVNLDVLCTQLAKDPAKISPTKFHNSVANAPAGYWSIATGSQTPSTAIAAGAETFALGLLEAAMIAHADQTDVALACYDIASPTALQTHRPIPNAFASGWLLTPKAGADALGHITLEPHDGPETQLAPGPLEELRRSNPSARALPLLQAIAQQRSASVQFSSGAVTSSATGWRVDYRPSTALNP